MVLHRLDSAREQALEPFHGHCGLVGLRGCPVDLPSRDEPPRVPYLAAEVASLLDLRLVIEYVVAGGRAEQHSEPDRVGAVLLYEHEGVGAVAEGLAHLAAELVADYSGEIDVPERHLVHELPSCHYHPRDPEEYYVRAGHEVARGIVVREVGVGFVVGMSGHLRVEYRNRPQPAGEPGVEHVFVLPEVFHAERGGERACLFESLLRSLVHHYAAVRQVVCRNPLSPPQLAGDAPVVRVLHPVAVGVAVLVGHEPYPARLHAVERHGGEGVHLEEPLRREPGLYHCVGAFRIAYRRGVFLCLDEVSGLLEHPGDLPARLEAVFAHEYLRLLVETAVVVDDFEHLEIVPEPYGVVVDIVRRGHLEAAGTEVHFHIVVLDDRDFLVYQRDEHFLAAQVVIPFVGGVYADGGVGHDGLGTGGRYHDIVAGGVSVAVGDEVAQVVEMALRVLMYNLVVAYRSEGDRIPVDHSYSPVYHALAVEVAEGGDYGLGEFRLHGETGALPVA